MSKIITLDKLNQRHGRSNSAMTNREALPIFLQHASDPKRYARSLAVYIDRKTQLTREVLTILTSIMGSEGLYNEDGTIDEAVLPRDYWDTPMIVVPRYDSSTAGRNPNDGIFVDCLALANSLNGVNLKDDCRYVTVKHIGGDAVNSIWELAEDLDDDFNQSKTNPNANFRVSLPFRWFLRTADGETEISANQEVSVLVSEAKASMGVRRSDDFPEITIDVSRTLEALADGVSDNSAVVGCLSALASSKGGDAATIINRVKAITGKDVMNFSDSAQRIIDIATDEDMSVDTRIVNVAAMLKEDLGQADEDLSIGQTEEDSLAFISGDYSGSAAKSMWSASSAGKAIKTLGTAIGRVVLAAVKVVVSVVKTAFKAISKLWKKYVTPAFVSKDFVESKDYEEEYCDVPAILVGGPDDGLSFSKEAFTSMAIENMIKQQRITGTFPHNKYSFNNTSASGKYVLPGLSEGAEEYVNTYEESGYDIERTQSYNEVSTWGHQSESGRGFVFAVADSRSQRVAGALVGDRVNAALVASEADSVHTFVWDLVSRSEFIDTSMPAAEAACFFSNDAVIVRELTGASYRRVLVGRGSDGTEIRLNMPLHELRNDLYVDLPILGGSYHCCDGDQLLDGSFIIRGRFDYIVNAGNNSGTYGRPIVVSVPVTVRCDSTGNAVAFTHLSNTPSAWPAKYNVLYVEDETRLSQIVNTVAGGTVEFSIVQGDAEFPITPGRVPNIGVITYTIKAGIHYGEVREFKVTPIEDMFFISVALQDEAGTVVRNDIIVGRNSAYTDGLNTDSGTAPTVYDKIGIRVNVSTADGRTVEGASTGKWSYSAGSASVSVRGYKVRYLTTATYRWFRDATIFRTIVFFKGASSTGVLTDMKSEDSSWVLPDGGVAPRGKWLSDTSFEFNTRPVSSLSADTLRGLLADVRNPIDHGCSVSIRYSFAKMQFLSDSQDNLRWQVFLNPTPHSALINAGQFKSELSDFSAFISAFDKASYDMGDYSEESGDLRAYQDLFCSYRLLDLILWMQVNPDELFSTYFHDSRCKILTDKQWLSTGEVNNSQFVSLLFVNTISEAAMQSAVTAILLNIVSNKAYFMSVYFMLFGYYPPFYPYEVGDRLGTPRWHISTDSDIQTYVDKVCQAVIVAALVVAAVAVLGFTAVKLKKALRLKLLKNEQRSFATKNEFSKTSQQVNSLSAENSKLKDRLKHGDISDEERTAILKQLSKNENELGKLKTQQSALLKRAYKNQRSTRRTTALQNAIFGKSQGGTSSKITSALSQENSEDPTSIILERMDVTISSLGKATV